MESSHLFGDWCQVLLRDKAVVGITLSKERSQWKAVHARAVIPSGGLCPLASSNPRGEESSNSPFRLHWDVHRVLIAALPLAPSHT